MAYDTKAMFQLIADCIAKSQTVEEAYHSVMKAANVEGVSLITYGEALDEIQKIRKK